jgi:hypothetical protein
MNCSKCHEELTSEASFCPSCGTKARGSSGAAAGECSGCGSPLDPGSSVCGACGKVNDAIGIGEKTKLTMNIGGKTKTFNLGDIGNLGVTVNTGDSSKALNLRSLGKVTSSATEHIKPGSGKKSKTVAVVLALFLYGFPTWVYTYQKDKSKLLISLVLVIATLLIGAAVHAPGIIGVTTTAIWIWAIVLAFKREKMFYSEYGMQ